MKTTPRRPREVLGRWSAMAFERQGMRQAKTDIETEHAAMCQALEFRFEVRGDYRPRDEGAADISSGSRV